MNNKPTLFKRIRNIIVSTIMPRYLEDLWLDISNGEKNAVLKYKGNPLVGGGSGSGSGSGGSDYQSSGDIVKDMIEQGTNFNWAKYVIDLSALPCFKPEAEWPVPNFPVQPDLAEFLSDGYVVVSYSISRTSYHVIAKQTGDSPSASIVNGSPAFVDCEPITALPVIPSSAVPAVIISVTSRAATRFSYVPVFGLRDDSVFGVCGLVQVDEKTWYVGYSHPLVS